MPYLLRALCIWLLLACTACEQTKHAASRMGLGGKGASGPNAADWIEAEARNGAPVAGPRQPELLWEYTNKDWDVEAVFPLTGGGVLLGATGQPGVTKASNADWLDKTKSKGLIKQMMEQRAVTHGALFKLDSAGQVSAKFELPASKDKEHWDHIEFACYRSAQPRLLVQCSRIVGKRDYEQWGDAGAESKRIETKQLTRLYSYDAALQPEWSLELDGLDWGGAGISLLPDGSAVLDLTHASIWDKGEFVQHNYVESIKVSAAGQRTAAYAFAPDNPESGIMGSLAVGGMTSSPAFLAGGPALYSARGSTRLLRFDSGLKLDWERDVVKRLSTPPVVLPDGSVALAASAWDYTGDAGQENQLRMDATTSTLLVYDRAGKQQRKDTLEHDFATLAGDTQGNLLLLESYSVDGKDEQVRQAWEASFKRKSNKPLAIPREYEVRLRKLDQRGLKLWDWSTRVKTKTLGPGVTGPVVDANGASWLWLEGALVCIDKDGKEASRLDLSAQKAKLSYFSSKMILGTDARIYQTASSGRLLVFGDKPTAEGTK